ncbi:MAG: spore maturation protein [Deltaproteobacteria bacterium]|nr:spore maturation protein [Deltaproteobacteria bacterium]MBM4325173.1 spore maturation protein [Deltaproteobacteria bacterium]MBM4347180.1 spore maturation protein [Deltaproteobacteria bacterium]
MNTIWVLLIVISILFSFLNGRLGEFTKSIFEGAKSAVEVSLFLLGIVSLWLGITKIIEDSGLIHRLSNFFQYFVRRLFKNIPGEHPAITSITLNLLANLFGLGNAATPLGIKAMQDLKTLNPDGETITFEMMVFIVINTASIQLISFTVIGILADYGSKDPSSIVLPTLLATFLSAVFALGLLFAVRRFFK